MSHVKHKGHPHDKMAAIPQFNQDHWEKKMSDVAVADGRYSSEMDQSAEYKASVDALASYAKSHKAKH